MDIYITYSSKTSFLIRCPFRAGQQFLQLFPLIDGIILPLCAIFRQGHYFLISLRYQRIICFYVYDRFCCVYVLSSRFPIRVYIFKFRNRDFVISVHRILVFRIRYFLRPCRLYLLRCIDTRPYSYALFLLRLTPCYILMHHIFSVYMRK